MTSRGRVVWTCTFRDINRMQDKTTNNVMTCSSHGRDLLGARLHRRVCNSAGADHLGSRRRDLHHAVHVHVPAAAVGGLPHAARRGGERPGRLVGEPLPLAPRALHGQVALQAVQSCAIPRVARDGVPRHVRLREGHPGDLSVCRRGDLVWMWLACVMQCMRDESKCM